MRNYGLPLFSAFILIFLLFPANQSAASIIDLKEQNGIVYLLFDLPSKIERYDADAGNWLPSIPLSGIPESFDMDTTYIYVGFHDYISKMSTSGTNQRIFTNISGNARNLNILNDHIVFLNSVNQITSIDKDTGTILNTTGAYSYFQGISVSKSKNRIFARTKGRYPSDICYIELGSDGSFGTIYDGKIEDSPYHGIFPSATLTFVTPQEDLVIDNSGTSYKSSDLTWNKSLAGAFDDISFHENAPLLLRGNNLFLYTDNYLEAGQYSFPEAPSRIEVVDDRVFGFFESDTAHGVAVIEIPISQIVPLEPSVPLNPESLDYSPDEIEVGSDGIIYLLSSEYKQIFRWSVLERKYFESIPITGCPCHMTYATENNRIYLSYDSGKINYIDPHQGPSEKPFVNAPNHPIGLEAFESYLFVCTLNSSNKSHFTYDASGNLISHEDRSHKSEEFIWNSANRKIYFIQDDTSPRDIVWEEIDISGVIGTKDDSPYHSSTGIDYPIRIAPDGSIVVLGSGNIYHAQTLERVATLPNEISDAVWLNGILYTVGNAQYVFDLQKWNDAYTAAEELTTPGSPMGLVSYNSKLIGIIHTHNRIGFVIWNAQLHEIFNNTPEFSLEKTAVQFRNSFTYQVTLAGESLGPYTETYKSVDEDSMYGNPAYIAETRVSGILVQKDWRTVSGTDVMIKHIETYQNNVLQHRYTIDPGRILYWVPEKIGEKEKIHFELFTDNVYSGWAESNAKVIGSEKLSLAFGQIDAFKIHYSYTTGTMPEYDIWVVPYLGRVKYSDDERTEVLVDFKTGFGQITSSSDADGDALKDWEELLVYHTKAKKADTDNDGIPDAWEVAYGLNPLDDDAEEDFDRDSVSNYDEYVSGRHPANIEPEKPVLNYPENGRIDVSIEPVLYAEPFSDGDGDTHAYTRWQISRDLGDHFEAEILYDFNTRKNLIALNIPLLILDPATRYYWRVKYTDSRNATSQWSDIYAFETTGDDDLDLDDNGVPDDQQLNDAAVDLDENGVPDMHQADIRCIHLQSNNIDVGLKTGSNVNGIDGLHWMDPEKIEDGVNRPSEMPFGLLNFKIQIGSVGGQASIDVHLSEPAAANARWFKYSPADGWQDFSAHSTFSPDRRKVTITLVDGGIGDLDGVANGIIIDPSGLGSNSVSQVPSSGGSGGGGGGGGCFIATAAFGSKYERHVTFLREFRDRVMLPTRLGKFLVDQYYKNSPPMAEWIKLHKTAKEIVRLMLVPVASFSWLYMNEKPATLAFIAFILLIFSMVFASQHHRRRFR